MRMEERDRLIRKEGIQEGIKQGLQEGLKQGWGIALATLSEMGLSKEQVLRNIKEECSIDVETMKAYIEEYWK